VYEGQNQYWGNVLSARSGMRTPEQSLDGLALVVAGYDNQPGRTWRSLLDTTNQPIIADREAQAYGSWQRGEDYYSEGQLIWLDADTLIRQKTGGKKSLDDFAAAFFGVEDGRVKVLTYTFDDVVKALNAVMPYDWATFLDERVNRPTTKAPLDGLARGGYKLVYTDKPNAVQEARAASFRGGGGGGASLGYSLGLSTGGDNKISSVLWNSPAFKAGLAPGMTIVAVNGMAADGDGLKDAVDQAAKDKKPIVLLVNDNDHINTVTIDYTGGLRYPHLERIAGTPDLLTAIHAAKK
jgi:predicted metalloprotease with PDZ domain